MDLAADDLQNAVDFPLAGWAPYEALYGCAPPNPVLPKDSTIALLINNATVESLGNAGFGGAHP